MQTLQSLSPAEQQMLVGLIVMITMAVIRALAHWRGANVSESALGKLAGYATVAGATGLATLIAGGYTPEFWLRWAVALGTAVGSWEGVSKTYNALIDRDALDAATAVARTMGKGLPVLLLAGVLCCCTLAPATAADLPAGVELSLVGALDGGPALGACASCAIVSGERYRLWADVGVKREDAETDCWLGASTDLPRKLVPSGARWGAGYLLGAGEIMLYVRTPIRF